MFGWKVLDVLAYLNFEFFMKKIVHYISYL